MRGFRRGRLAVALGAAGAAAVVTLAVGCATARVSTEARADGSTRLRCRSSLPDCLLEAERRCQGRHYVVLRAVDEHDHRGGAELNLDVRTSEAIFRCGPAIAWPSGFEPMAVPGEAAAEPAPPPPAPPTAPPSVPARACVPGATQACVGPGGCVGGQACLPDGAGFAACDCGAAGNGVGTPR